MKCVCLEFAVNCEKNGHKWTLIKIVNYWRRKCKNLCGFFRKFGKNRSRKFNKNWDDRKICFVCRNLFARKIIFLLYYVVCPRETMKYSRLWLLKKRNKIWGETTLPFFSMFISFIRKEEICLHTNWWMSDKMWNSFVDFFVAAKLLNVCICVPLHSCACLDGENFQKFSLHISCFAFAHTLFVCAFFGLHSNEKH